MATRQQWRHRDSQQEISVGYLVTEKKFEKINFPKVLKLCKQARIPVKQLRLDRDLDQQGPCCVILHRVSDLMGEVKRGDVKAAERVKKFKQYLARNPHTVVLDPLSAVRKLSNRFKMYDMIRKKIAFKDVQVPAFVRIRKEESSKEIVKKARRAGLIYPLLAKPVLAHKHDLILIYNEKGVRKLSEDRSRLPMVLQTYIPHDGVLQKVYVLGDKLDISTRPSLKNLSSNAQNNVSFHSHEISKPGAQTDLHEQKKKTAARVDEAKIRQLVKRLKEITQLTMLGIDIVVERGTGRHFVIDINYFPGYDEVAQVPEAIFHHVLAALSKHHANRSCLKSPMDDTDNPSTASEVTDDISRTIPMMRPNKQKRLSD